MSKEMAKLDWKLGADAIMRKVRALDDRPGTWSTFNEERIGIHRLTESLLSNTLKTPGEVALVENSLLIRCQDST